MTNDEILKKAQLKKPNQLDEMELDILQKSSHWGMIVGLTVCLILMGIKIYFNQPYQDIYAVYCSMLCGQFLYKWFRQKEKYMLFCGVLWGFTASLLFIVYLMKIL